MMGFEPMTSSLPRKRSTPELHRLKNWVAGSFRKQGEHHKQNPIKNVLTLSGKRGSNSRPQPWKGCALPTELFPRCLSALVGLYPSVTFGTSPSNSIKNFFQWGEKDSNLRSRATADLQSAPVGHFGISPKN